MPAATTPLAPKPAHVPDELVIDWDFTQPPGGIEDLNAAWKTLHDGPDIVWTPRNGGHWIATRAEDIEYIQRNHDPFSMRRIVLPDDIVRPRILPIEMDPPEHTRYRSILNQFFTPRAIKELQDEARRLAIELIEGFKQRGHCDFIDEFSMKLPILIFMKMVDQPLEDLDILLEWTEMSVRPKQPEDRNFAFQEIHKYLAKVVEGRRAKPGTDLLSGVVTAQVAGNAIPYDDLLSILTNLMFGGLDTVASSLGFAAKYLAENPDKRRAGADDLAAALVICLDQRHPAIDFALRLGIGMIGVFHFRLPFAGFVCCSGMDQPSGHSFRNKKEWISCLRNHG